MSHVCRSKSTDSGKGITLYPRFPVAINADTKEGGKKSVCSWLSPSRRNSS